MFVEHSARWACSVGTCSMHGSDSDLCCWSLMRTFYSLGREFCQHMRLSWCCLPFGLKRLYPNCQLTITCPCPSQPWLLAVLTHTFLHVISYVTHCTFKAVFSPRGGKEAGSKTSQFSGLFLASKPGPIRQSGTHLYLVSSVAGDNVGEPEVVGSSPSGAPCTATNLHSYATMP